MVMLRVKSALDHLLERLECSYRQLCAMFLIVFMLPLIATYALTQVSLNALERQVEATLVTMSDQTQRVLDSRFADLDIMLEQLNNHTTIRYLLNQSNPLTANVRYMTSTVISDLRRQYANLSTVSDCYIYMWETDLVISTSTYCSSRYFYDTYYNYQNMKYDEWLNDEMRSYHAMTLLPVQKVNSVNGVSNMLTVLQTLPRGDKWKSTGTVALLINSDEFINQLTSKESHDASIFVLDDAGNVLIGSDSELAVQDVSELSGNEGFFTLNIGGASIFLSYVRSTKYGLIYVTQMPAQRSFEEVRGIRGFTQWAILVLLMLGGLMTAVMAYISYMPMRTILDKVEPMSKGHVRDTTLSLHDIGSLVSQAVDDRQKYETQLPLIVENYVNKLIHGKTDVESELDLFSEISGFRFPSNVFAVICLVLPARGDNGGDVFTSVRDAAHKLNQLPDSGMDGYTTLVSEDTLAILCSMWAGQSQSHLELLHTYADRLRRSLAKQDDICMRIGIGMVSVGYADINHGFRQALLAATGTSNGNVCMYGDIANLVHPADYSYTIDTEKKLINCTCSGDIKRVRELLADIAQQHVQEARADVRMTQCFKYDMMGTIYKCAQELQSEGGDDEAANMQSIINELALALDIESTFETLRNAFERLCLIAYRGKHSHNDELRDSILRFIQENYRRPEMGLDTVAREFGIAPTYLSRFFKEQTGGNFIDYVNRLRINQAAQLLHYTEKSHAEIAEECGLSGAQGLNRLFNRVLGVSPSSYRQLIREGKLSISNQ